ncbi:MAG TPA: Hsp70 family protein [Desulfobacterales bacterium]
MSTPRYIVGLDLGTTNSILAYIPISELDRVDPPETRTLEIPQLVGPGAVAAQTMLPSFIYVPGEKDIAADARRLPWSDAVRFILGELARRRGAEVPERLIHSAKSWLCHTSVDRSEALLPWGSSPEIEKLSPVEASAAILDHIRCAWNHRMAREDESLALENQDIYLTVPASFDAVARELTVRAAQMAQLSNVTLLEEPQAAFYAWIAATQGQWRQAVSAGDRVLVCDIGGGTSDFSLIQVSESAGNLELERIAVGSHLLVGGDNMDLALAYAAANRMKSGGERLDAWQMRALWNRCRSAKETLLENTERQSVTVSILGRSSSVIGGTRKLELPRTVVEEVILDGFFPPCPATAHPEIGFRTGIQEAGLAYESDPAVTRHLAHFIRRQSDSASVFPTAILFNGGVMKAPLIRNRIIEVLASWQDGSAPRLLESTDLDLAVARGAACYGLARRGRGIRIRSGLNQSYYIGIAAALPAVPGMPAPIKALCVAPFGMEEDSETDLSEKVFNLIVGEKAKFEFLGSPVRTEDPVGAIIEDWESDIEPITTVETVLEGEPGSVVPVSIQGRLTAVGTLELWCVARESERRWKLEFNVRESS